MAKMDWIDNNVGTITKSHKDTSKTGSFFILHITPL